MMPLKKNVCRVVKGIVAFDNALLPKTKSSKNPKKLVVLLFTFLVLINGVYAQTEYEFPRGDFWSLDAGFGMSSILVEGSSFQFLIDPKLWLSSALMVGAKAGVNYSAEKEESSVKGLGNILTFEGQVYLRWNFLRFGKEENPWNLFFQGGLGLISSYRGTKNPFNEVTETRGSVLFDAALGLTIPLSRRWHLEPEVRGGYPHIFGASLTAGYKFPLPQKTITTTNTATEYRIIPKTEYVEVIKDLPPEEIVRRVMIFAVEFVLFGPDIGRYNIGIDRDAQQLNELVLNYVSDTLKAHSNYRVRIEGHANPYTINYSEIEDLQILSAMRSDVVSHQLKQRGVSDEQIVMISFGGTRTATSEWDVRNRNRRVELIIIEVDTE